MNELRFASVKTLQEKISKKELSVPELLDFFIKRFDNYDQILGSALEIFEKNSVLKRFVPDQALLGIPGIIKDNICQKKRITSCASKMLANFEAPYDATVTERLLSSGALIMGRANMDEFAMGSSTENSAFKKTKNPWDIERVPGGTSGGSAAAVSAGLVPWSLGTDTGGSIRQPAVFCGVVGIKPTYGLVSRYGLIAYGSSLDQIGPITRTVYDNALLLSVIAGHDVHDSTSAPQKPKDYTQNLTGKLRENLTIGILDNALEIEGFDKEIYTALSEVIKIYEKLGAKIKHIRLPMMDHSTAAYFMISRAEAASNLARFDGVRYGYRSSESENLETLYKRTREQFGAEVKLRILVGNYVLSAGHADAYYKSANIVRALIRDEFMQAFKDVDLILAPGSAGPAFKLGAYEHNKFQMDLQDYFTGSINLAGIPAIAVPCGFTKDKLPIGFQLFGPDFSETDLYQTAYAYEAITQWHKEYPKQFS